MLDGRLTCMDFKPYIWTRFFEMELHNTISHYRSTNSDDAITEQVFLGGLNLFPVNRNLAPKW